jgi:hypothetical protein
MMGHRQVVAQGWHLLARRLHLPDANLCPGGNTLTTIGTLVNDDTTILYRASKPDT